MAKGKWKGITLIFRVDIHSRGHFFLGGGGGGEGGRTADFGGEPIFGGGRAYLLNLSLHFIMGGPGAYEVRSWLR